MMIDGFFEAQLMWRLLFPADRRELREPSADYGGMLDGMEAAQLMALMVMVQERLKRLGVGVERLAEPVELFIDKNYNIRMCGADGQILNLRPLVKTLFILFLKHPEGILLKQRDAFRAELEEIYGMISPNTDRDDVKARVARLVDLEDNSFSEKASVLNARLKELLPDEIAGEYQISGYNGCPRKIRLNPLLVHWE
ncbi:MAG: hypothetical protein IKW84_09565 [Bacteroidaceae bacterium]|nr:hypothetical protein [Bacteroidaceae bacterium]